MKLPLHSCVATTRRWQRHVLIIWNRGAKQDNTKEIPKKNRLCIDSCLQLSFAKKEMAAAIVRSCSLLLSWMMASRPSCRDFSLIRWDLVFLLSKVLTTSQCTTTSKQVGSCAWRTQTAKFSFACGANKKAFGLRLPSLKAQDRAKLRRSEFVAKWSYHPGPSPKPRTSLRCYATTPQRWSSSSASSEISLRSQW